MAENEFEGVSLMDLAGLDTTGLEAKRIGDILPKFLGDFECIDAGLKELKKQVGGEEKTTGFIAEFKWKTLGVVAKIDAFDESEMPGKVHQEARFIANSEGIQYLIGFLEDIGIKQRGKLGDIVEMAKGLKIRAQITHRKDKNDSDKVYSGLTKIKPLVA